MEQYKNKKAVSSVGIILIIGLLVAGWYFLIYTKAESPASCTPDYSSGSCTPNWVCGDFGSCSGIPPNDQKSKTCTDLNCCALEKSQNSYTISQACSAQTCQEQGGIIKNLDACAGWFVYASNSNSGQCCITQSNLNCRIANVCTAGEFNPGSAIDNRCCSVIN